ncbi:MBL fold metallo-hydrolase (plasmid) [Bernardetia sp. Wsw4-3y2]|uniref:MBL fold metallo-hydrolase n=1 Tax=Bernardetia sp. Wsw4-3y2 TaxID=3127471 RepID=UPI0030D27FDC
MNYFKILFLFVISILNISCSEAKVQTEITKQNKSNKIVQSDFSQKKITDNLYVLKAPSYNTNVGVFIGVKELLLIDPMTGMNNQKDLLKAIRELSDKPIKYVLNTHSHQDHSGANSFFMELGATIISQENSKYSKAIHDVTFKNTYTVKMESETVELYHIKAHTFDDVLIYFKNNNTVFMGDTYMTNSFPHFYYGGGSKGHLDIIDKALSLGDESTTIVAAHGKLSSNKKELSVYKSNSIKWINRIKELNDAGKTSEQIANDKQIKELSLVFNDGNNISAQRLSQTIKKTVSVNLVANTIIPVTTLRSYEGSYQYENGQIDEVIYQEGKLFLRSEGNYIYEIVSLSETNFHLKGQTLNQSLIFDNVHKQFIFFNGKEELVANKK